MKKMVKLGYDKRKNVYRKSVGFVLKEVACPVFMYQLK